MHDYACTPHHVSHRADAACGKRHRVVLGIPPVTDLEDGPVRLAVCALVQQNVVQLDVSVGDAHLVTVVQRKHQLLKQPACLWLWQAALLLHMRQQ